MRRCSVFSVEKGYHFLWKLYERVTVLVKNGIQKGKGLDLRAENPCAKLC